ncbi:MAG: siroheme synthase, N-terminal domain protein, partial [uncultured archaeon A07HN63]
IRAAPAVDDMAGWLDRIEPAMVVAATDDGERNAAVAEAASERDILVNRTDRAGDRDVGSVVVPATVEDDPVSVAISTGGQSPALSRYLRQQIEEEIENAGAMAELTGRLRAELKESHPPAERRELIREVVRSPAVWKALHTGVDKARYEAASAMGQDERGSDNG